MELISSGNRRIHITDETICLSELRMLNLWGFIECLIFNKWIVEWSLRVYILRIQWTVIIGWYTWLSGRGPNTTCWYLEIIC